MVIVNISILQVSVLTRGTGCSVEPRREKWENQTNGFKASKGKSSLPVLFCIKININSFQKVAVMVVKEQDSHETSLL